MKNQTKTKTKSLILISLVFYIMLLIFPNVANASTTYMSGDYSYTVSNNKATITEYQGSNSIVNIPSKLGKYTVTGIEYQAFRDCEEIETISIPATIEKIDDNAFAGCNFTTVKFATNCKITELKGFGNMSNLSSINIPNNVKTIGSYALRNNPNLTTITIPANVTSIEYCAFADCTGLTTITIPTNVSKIDDNAFSGCDFTTVKFASDCKITEFSGFANMSNLSSINIPNNVKKIKSYALRNNPNLTKITIPASVTEIEYCAFADCTGLTTMTIPTNVSKIDDNAFSGCNFTTVNFASDCKITEFSGFANMSKLTSINIPNNVKKIKSYALRNNPKLTKITIPASVAEIEYCAIADCTGLTTITIPRRVEKIDSQAFSGCNFTTVNFANDCMITEFPSFANMKTLTKINIPRSVTKLGNYIFRGCTGLSEVVIPYSATEIGYCTFADCSNITVTIPSSVTKIDDQAFSGATNLKIKCESGSYAETYCNNKGIRHILTTISKPTTPIKINKCSISGYGAKNYTGRPITANIVVGYGSKTLKSGTDYIVEYSNNVNIGTAKITIIGFGNYIGKIEKSFKIIPATVTGVTNSAKTTSALTIKWTKNAGAISGYRVYLYNSSSKSYQQIVTTSNNYYTIKNLKPGTIYRYAIKAYSTVSGATFVSNAYSSIITTATMPVAPKVKASSKSTSQIKLSWGKVSGANGYEIYQYNSSKKTWKKIKSTTSTAYTVSKLKSGATYKFKVIAYKNVNNKKIYGAFSSVITTATKPSTPKITSLTSKSKKANLKWKKISGASGYEVYMATSKKGKYSKIKTISKGSTVKYTKSKLKKNKKYYFKIRAYKTVNGKKEYSSYSSIKNIKVK